MHPVPQPPRGPKAQQPKATSALAYGQKPVAQQKLGTVPAKTWCFSFQYWEQIEYFGLKGQRPDWFVALLERLRELSKIPLKKLQGEGTLQDQLHYHDVSWSQRNIPIRRADLTWLPGEILANPEDYPLYQFSITQALGRVAGFWRDNVFEIVLLDPHHNLQPTRKFNYATTKCYPQASQLDVWLGDIGRILSLPHSCSPSECTLRTALRSRQYEHQPYNVVYLSSEFVDELRQMVADQKATSVEGALELAILEFRSTKQ